MELRQLKTFRTVATLLNFNQAAKVLNYAQSTVSAQIKGLEDEIGLPLFWRLGRQVTLTEAGERLLNHVHKILAIAEEAMADVTERRDPAGVLTIRAPQTVATYYLPKILAKFQPQYPKIHFDVNSCAFFNLEHELQIGTTDLAFLLAESVQGADLKFEMLRIEPLVLAAHPRHELAGRQAAGFQDLRDQSIFLPKADCGYRMVFEQTLMAEHVEPMTVLEINSIEAIKKCILSRLGVTLIPEIAVREEIARGELVALRWQEEFETAILMIWHKDKWLSPMLRAFMEAVRTVMDAD